MTEIEPQQAHITDITGFGCTANGLKGFLRFQSTAEEFDVLFPYQLLPQLIDYAGRAFNAAYTNRRQLGVTDDPIERTDLATLISVSFGVAADKSSMTIVAQTSKGPVALQIGRDHARAFAEATASNAEFLMAPPKDGSN